jgi:hypothetical protein
MVTQYLALDPPQGGLVTLGVNRGWGGTGTRCAGQVGSSVGSGSASGSISAMSLWRSTISSATGSTLRRVWSRWTNLTKNSGASLDDLVGLSQYYPRHCQAERIGSFQIDHQLELTF